MKMMMGSPPVQQRFPVAARVAGCSCHPPHPGLLPAHPALPLPASGYAPWGFPALAPGANLRFLRWQAAAVQASTSTVNVAQDSSAGGQPANEADSAANTIRWTSYWWPVQAIENLNPKVPVHVDLLGKSMVVWGDSNGNWHCMEDKCPHRLAPLSEGRVEKDNIMCCYHGWTFSGDGSCTSIPQLASDPKAHDNACSSKRSCVVSYPTRVESGLVWVWPEAGPEAAVTAAATPTTAWLSKGMNPYYVRDIPVRFDIVVENFIDPSHAAYAHHGVIGDRNKPTNVWNHMTVDDINQHGVLATGNFFGSPIHMKYQPPFKITHYTDATRPVLQLAVVPLKLGWTRVFFHTPRYAPVMDKLPLPFRWWLKFRMSIVALDHVRSRNAIFDGDNYMLHKVYQLLPVSQGVGAAVTSAYYMPAGDDRMIVALRKWFQRFGGDVPTCSAADEAAMPPSATKEQAIDRWNQHTKQCSHCLKALAALDKLQAVNVVVGVAAAVAAVAQLVAAGALAHMSESTTAAAGGLTRAAAAGPAAAASTASTHWAGPIGTAISSWWQACHVAGLQNGILVAAVLAAVCWLLYGVINTMRQKFYYEEYIHALRD